MVRVTLHLMGVRAMTTAIVPGLSDPLIDRESAAKMLGIHPRMADAAIRCGAIKAIRFGRSVKVRRSELERVASEGFTIDWNAAKANKRTRTRTGKR